jgi:hypothetical protein
VSSILYSEGFTFSLELAESLFADYFMFLCANFLSFNFFLDNRIRLYPDVNAVNYDVWILVVRNRICKAKMCEGWKELSHTMVRLQLILFSKITGAFLFRTFGGFLYVPTKQICCLTGAIISEARMTNGLYI